MVPVEIPAAELVAPQLVEADPVAAVVLEEAGLAAVEVVLASELEPVVAQQRVRVANRWLRRCSCCLTPTVIG